MSIKEMLVHLEISWTDSFILGDPNRGYSQGKDLKAF